MVSYRGFRFLWSLLSPYRDVNGANGEPGRDKRVMVATRESRKVGPARRPRSEQNSDSLVRELLSRFCQMENLVPDLFAGALLRAAACFTVPRRGVSAVGKANPECFRVAKDTILRHRAEAAVDAGTDAR